MNPLHAKWVVSFYDYMKNHGDIVLTGRRKSNIGEVFNSEQDSNPLKKSYINFGRKCITRSVENDYSLISYDSLSIICTKILDFCICAKIRFT